ncbi:hypothetical protein RSAG8_01299, partial [Rhizoctonia solani AG-8 WAC10335]
MATGTSLTIAPGSTPQNLRGDRGLRSQESYDVSRVVEVSSRVEYPTDIPRSIHASRARTYNPCKACDGTRSLRCHRRRA